MSKWYLVPISGRTVSCHDETVQTASKKQGTSASADSANDAVQVDETVRVPQDLINGKEFKGIELRIVINLSWRWRRQPRRPRQRATSSSNPLRSNGEITEEHFSATSSTKSTEDTDLSGDELIESRESGMR